MLIKENKYITWLGSSFIYFLAIIGYFFSISEASFAWRFPDEILASDIYNVRGLIGCIKFYYLETTIQRLVNARGLCLMSSGVELFETRYMGWVFSRLIVYILLPLSVAYSLRKLIGLSFYSSLLISLIISTVTFFILSDTNGLPSYLYGADLTAYGTATITFFFLLGVFPNVQERKYYFSLFSFLFFLNITSCEFFLVISGFFIPLFVLYFRDDLSLKKPGNFIYSAFRDKHVRVLSALWTAGALFAFLAPSFARRQSYWPASESVLDGLLYVALSLEETLYLLYQSGIFIILFLLLGIFIRIFSKYKHDSRNNLLFALLFLTPILYLAMISFLTGLVPAASTMPVRPEEYQVIGDWLSELPTGHKGAIGVRQNLFFFMLLYLNIFLVGFFSAGLVIRSGRLANFSSNISIYSFLTAILLFHPDGIGSVKILSVIFSEKFNLEEYKPSKTEGGSHSLLEMIFPKSSMVKNVGGFLFKRDRFGQHESVVASVAVNNHLIENKGKYVPENVFDHIYMGFKISSLGDWRRRIYDAYGVKYEQDKIFYLFENRPDPNVFNLDSYGAKEFEVSLSGKKLLTPTGIHFNRLIGSKFTGKTFNCKILEDKQVEGNHYVALKNVRVTKGLSYFVFEALPTETDVYIGIVGEKTEILFPWSVKQKLLMPWKNKSIGRSLYPVFRQNVDSAKLLKFSFVVYSEFDQEVEVRWLHGLNDKINYTGNRKNISYPCASYYGQISE